MKHAIILGSESEIDSNIHYNHLLKVATGIEAIRVDSHDNNVPELLDNSNYLDTTNVVVVYVGNFHLDFIEVHRFLQTNANVIVRGITYIFLCRFKPFFSDTILEKHYTLIYAGNRDILQETKMLRADIKIAHLKRCIDSTNNITNDTSVKNTLLEFLNTELNKTVKKRNAYVNSVSAEFLSKIKYTN